MASWTDIFNEIDDTKFLINKGVYGYRTDEIIKKYVKKFADMRDRNVIVYYSDWLNKTIKGPNIDINDNDMVAFMNAVYGLDKSKGLDLIIHTPGGDPLATEGIVKYLHKIFGNNIEIFVPHMAMSAGTMLVCSSKCVWMGKHSFLGPIDPQFNGVSAYNVKKEFEEAKKELVEEPKTFRNWEIRLFKYSQAAYYLVTDYIKLSSKLASEWLKKYMFEGDSLANSKSRKITKKINVNTGSHAKHFDRDSCIKFGFNVKCLESDSKIQDVVLSIYYALQICGDKTSMCKYVVNQNGKAFVGHGIIGMQRG